jgi:hypothetical protein
VPDFHKIFEVKTLSGKPYVYIPLGVPVIHRLWSYTRVKMWITITTGVNNFFSGVSEGRGLRRSKGLKMAFLSLFKKLVETRRT